VLGLDRGGSCIGLAFRVPGELRDEVIAYLRERELVTSVYLERLLQVRLETGARDGALLRRRPRT
jgi:cation transport protein ChaC